MFKLRHIFPIVLLQVILNQYFVWTAATSNQGKTYCDNADCIKVAEDIKQFIDPNVDPCDDFHHFVCGGVLKNDSKFDYNSRLDRDQEEFKAFLDAYVTSADSSADSEALKTLKAFYRACADEETIEREGVQPLFQLTGGVLVAEGHKISNSDWLDNFQWEEAMVKARRLGLPFEWFFKVDVNFLRKKVVVGLPFNVTEPQNRSAILDAFDRVVIAFRGNLHDERMALDRVLDFQIELSKIFEKHSKTDFGDLDPSSNENFTIYSRNLLELVSNITGIQVVTGNVDIPNTFKSYASDLSHLLRRTPNRTVAFYVSWYLLQEVAPLMPKTVREAIWKIDSQFRVRRYPDDFSKASRSQQCLFLSKKLFNFVPEAEYLKRHVQDPRRPAVKRIVSEIEPLYITKFPQFKRLNLTVAEPWSGDVDIDSIDKLFCIQAFNYTSKKILQMAMERRKSYLDAYFATFGSEESRQELLMEYTNIFGTYSNPKGDNLQMPLVTYQNSSLFNTNLPQYMNYGGFGMLFVIYLSSARVTEPLIKCKSGTLLKDNEPLAHGVYVTTLATELALEAYEKTRREANQHDPEPKLPDLDFGPAQMLFIQSQSLSCFKKVARPTTRFAGGDDRGIMRRFVLETARNSPSFARAFGCPVGSPMNPERKCLQAGWASEIHRNIVL